MGVRQDTGLDSMVPELSRAPSPTPAETSGDGEKNVLDLPAPTADPTLVKETDTDNTTRFYNLHRSSAAPLTADVAAKITRRNFWFLLAQTWWISFLIHLDEGTLGQASTMGIFNDVDMTKKQFNDLFVVYYVGYLVALWPGAWVAQRVGHKYFITGSLFLWSLLIGLHPAVKTGKQLMALRFILGLTQSQIIPSTTVLHQSFFPPRKSPWVQLLWWAAGSLASILLTMVSYRLILNQESGILVGGLASWKWLNIICAILTFAVFVPLFIFLPDSPVDAKWLGTEQKVHTIEMMRESHSGIANSAFKWDQVKECFTDPKSWLFIFHMFFNELPNNTGAQLPLIVVGFGFTPAESALLNIVKPIWGSVLVCITALVLNTTNLGTGYVCAMSYIPCIVGGIIELSAPWSNKVALVLGTQISSFKPSYLLGLTWAGTTTTGYTKKLTLMSTCVVSASVANMISPEFWQEKYQPRYTLPWSFMTAIWVICPTMCLIIRYYLSKENKRRDLIMMSEPVGVESNEKDLVATFGSEQELVHIHETDLDLTDRQNLRFRYPL
ncbi:hypothetical protein I317_01796 [Kwoniella heveanensis CBS 569]|nr:hypothetical protein I317_01796 [Kwoniella heveanensis CBS 569]